MNIIPHQASGIVVPQQEENGYFNATALSKVHHQATGQRRDVADWLRNKGTSDMLSHLSGCTGIPVDQLVMLVTDGPNENRGTYIHPKIATRFAIWLNDDLGYKVECWVEDWVKSGKKPDIASGVTDSIQVMDAISGWLTEAGVDTAIASMWKLQQLGRRHPELKPETESAKQLIGGSNATESQYLTPTELGDRVGMTAREVNAALASAGLQKQIEHAKGRKKWDLTDEGKQYGIVFLASGQNSRWSGGQIKWLPNVVDVLRIQQPA